MFDLISIGELLIDFFPEVPGGIAFGGKPGGAPCNVAAQANKLGDRTAVVCKLGSDQFGHYLKNYVAGLGIDDSFVSFTDKANTTLAFVHLDETGNRSFSFYRKPGADQMLEEKDMPLDVLAQAGIVAFGGVGLSAEPVRSTLFSTLAALRGKTTIAYDPNLRPNLWSEGEEAMRKFTLQGMEYADIVKLADEELSFLLQDEDMLRAANTLTERYPNIKLCFITAGAGGCYVFNKGELIHCPAYATKVVDTTGAGDAFFGAMLHKVLHCGKDVTALSAQELADMARYANAAGSTTAASVGAIAAMPDEQGIQNCLANVPEIL